MSQDILDQGHSKISLDILDLGLWDLTLPPGLEHPGMSPDIPGHLGPGNQGLNTALQVWDILGCPGGIPGHHGPGTSRDILGNLGPGTLGLNTASRSGTSWDVSGYPRTPWTWDSGT